MATKTMTARDARGTCAGAAVAKKTSVRVFRGARIARSFRIAAIALCLVPSLAAIGRAEPSRGEVTTGLHAIERVATDIAAGKYDGAHRLRGPARTIAITWAQIEPVLVRRGYALVETRFANRSIVAFERTFKQPAKARSAARDVASTVADLLQTRKDYAPGAVSH